MFDVLATVILISLALIFNKSKLVCLLLFVFMFTLSGWNTWNGDYDAYESIYYTSVLMANQEASFEQGYNLINIAFNVLGFSYQDYLKVVYFFILSVFAYCSLKYSKYPALFSALYLIIFIMEYVFIRNYLTHSLLILSFLIVFKEVRFYKFWFLLIIFLASTIHSTSILWFVFIFAFHPKEKIININKVLFLVTMFIVFSALLFQPILLMLGGEYAYKLLYYLYDGGLTTVFFVHPLIVFLVYFFFKNLFRQGAIPKNYIRIYIIVININLISLFYLGLYYHIPYFARFLRFLFTIDLVFMLSAFRFISVGKTKVNMVLILCSIFFALLVMFMRSTHSLTVYPLYKKNIIWGEEYYDPTVIKDYSNINDE